MVVQDGLLRAHLLGGRNGSPFSLPGRQHGACSRHAFVVRGRHPTRMGAKALRDFLPGMVVACGAFLALVIIASNSDVHEPSAWKMASKILWTNASTRPPLLLVLAIAGWAWVVQVCNSCGMKIELVLQGASRLGCANA